MNSMHSEGMNPRELMRLFMERRRFWVIPTILGGMLGMMAALVLPQYWEASQALIIRETATGSESHQQGRFASLSEMKTLQETVLELAKSKSVIEATLTDVGPPSNWPPDQTWPTPRAISDFRDQIRMLPPGGAEFGMTEVFYLGVRDTSRERALQLVGSILKHLDSRFRKLRDHRAQSMIAELENTCAIAETNLANATEQLAAFETEVGADLIELRLLQSSPSASSDLRQRLLAIENAKQLHETQRRQDEELLSLLRTIREDSNAIIATPDILLSSQPALRQLKEGLIDAQLATAGLLGTRSPNHPEVLASEEAEAGILRHLHAEVETAIKGLEVSLQLNSDQVAAMERQSRDGRSRLKRLAQLRAEYANLVALSDNRTRLAEAVRAEIAEARASQASAQAASLIQCIDDPETGVNPVGPRRSAIAGAGLVGGWVLGLGLFFLFAATPASENRPLPEPATAIPTYAAPEPVPADEPIPAAVPAEVDDVGSPAAEVELEPIEVMDSGHGAFDSPDRTAAPEIHSETFGLFQGMSLEEASRQVAARE